jgi:adenosylhomocysteine nucleosidase
VFSGEIDESAELASYLLITHFHPRAMLFSGTAGAEAPWINVGDVVLSGFVVDKSSIHYRLGGYQTPYAGIEIHAPASFVRGAVIAGYGHRLPTPFDARGFGRGPGGRNKSWTFVTAFAGSRQLAALAARTPSLGSTSRAEATGADGGGRVANKLLLGVIGEAQVWTTPLSWIAAQNSVYETDAEENEGSGFMFACAIGDVPALLIRGISDTPWFPNVYDGVDAADHAARVARYVVGHVPDKLSTDPVRFQDLSRATNARTAGYMIASRADYGVGPVTGITYRAADGASRSLTPSALARFQREYRYGAANP